MNSKTIVTSLKLARGKIKKSWPESSHEATEKGQTLKLIDSIIGHMEQHGI